MNGFRGSYAHWTCRTRQSPPHLPSRRRPFLFVWFVLFVALGMIADRSLGLTIKLLDETGATIDKLNPGKLTVQQADAFREAARLWEGKAATLLFGASGLYDPTTVTVVVGFADLDPGVLGQAKTKRVKCDYKTVRAAMGADAQGFHEKYTVSQLPSTGGQGQVTTEIALSSANARALGLGTGSYTLYGVAPPFSADASITFANSFEPDFDYERPIAADKYDVISIAAHEMGHALGFLSWIDTPTVLKPQYTLDLWRFKETGGPHNLTSEARQDKAGPAEYYDGQLNNKSMSRGVAVVDNLCKAPTDPKDKRYQASHWRCNAKDIMRPALAMGKGSDPTWDDTHALDYIGYDSRPRLINFHRPLIALECGWFDCIDIWPFPLPGPCLSCPDFEGIFEHLPDPPFPEDLDPPFDPDVAVRIGLDFDVDGLRNRSGLGLARFHVEMENPNPETLEPDPDIYWENLNPGPIEPVYVLPPAITDLYFVSDTTGGVAFTFTDTFSDSGAWLDPHLGEFGGYHITGFLDGEGDDVVGDVDAVVTFDLLADERLVPDANAQNVFVASRSAENLIRIVDPVALGIPLADFDCNGNGIPDDQEVDTDGDGIIDECEPGVPELAGAFAFGSRLLSCPTFNDPAVNYTMVYHGTPAELEYQPERGWGYEVVYPLDSPYGDRSGYGIFGPFDDSPNNRNNFADACPEELYDSFIGAKDFTNECSGAAIGDPCAPCAPTIAPEGITFRVDVPNGMYRFVGAFGEADNVHAHRIVAEDGGSGPPEMIGPNHVVLVSNFDQAQYAIGEADLAQPGEGVFARVGFDDKIPPPGDDESPSPQFVNMDEHGLATDGFPNSPMLRVTQGYIRIHQLQGNSNDGPGGPRDGNGGDIVILELWKVGPLPPEPIVLLAEDFEGLPLGPNVDEALVGEAVWTDTPPEGWIIDESGVPGIGDPNTDGVTEWAGWAFADKAWWTETADDQNRSQFELGRGTVAVADPDEWDDADHPGPNSEDPYDTWLTTPAIDISGCEAGTVQLKFDSSWRPEFDDNYHQTANITASFDGAEPIEVLRWESDSGRANFKGDATNETVIVDLGNPEGATSVVLTFGLFDAGNDWWWAIDNVEVVGALPIPLP